MNTKIKHNQKVSNLLLMLLKLILFTFCLNRNTNKIKTNQKYLKLINSGTQSSEKKYFIKQLSKRAYIKIIENGDIPYLHLLVKKNKDHLTKYMPSIYNQYGKSLSKALVSFKNRNKNNYTYGVWYNEQIIGQVGLHSFDFYGDQSAEIMYWIDKDSQNKGISYSACRMLIKIAFSKYKRLRLNSMIVSKNMASQGLSKSLGFVNVQSDLNNYIIWPYTKRKSLQEEKKSGKVPLLYILTKNMWDDQETKSNKIY